MCWSGILRCWCRGRSRLDHRSHFAGREEAAGVESATFGGSAVAVAVPQNGALFWGGDPAGTGLTVNSTNKTLAFTNTGAGTLTLDLVLAGDA